MHTRSGANYLHRCVPKFKNVAALDARNTDGINKTRFAIQTNAKQMISYHTKEQVIETGSHIDPVYVLLASPDNLKLPLAALSVVTGTLAACISQMMRSRR